jgi:hypothetical protein
VIDYLTGDGQSEIDVWIKAEWGPFTFTSAGYVLTHVVHAYARSDRSQVRTGRDYKLKFRDEIRP